MSDQKHQPTVQNLRDIIDLVNDSELSTAIALDVLTLYFRGEASGPVKETVTELGLWHAIPGRPRS